MPRSFRWPGLLLAFTLAIPATADDKPAPKQADKQDKPDKEKLVPAGQLQATLVSTSSDKGGITFRIKVPYLTPNRQVQYKDEDITLVPTDDLKVRVLTPPVVFDDKGRPKRYSAKELKELKGEGNLPGYTADLESLHPNQTVLLYLMRKKKPAKKEGALEKDGLDDDKPLVRMIVILAEPRQ